MIPLGTQAGPVESPFTPEQQQRFDAGLARAIAKYPPDRRKAALLAALHLAQDELGWLPDPAMAYVGFRLDVPPVRVREVSIDDAAIQLRYAASVIVVPGYGLAVAQAQHNVRELAEILEARGVDVKYAIHPVAGRMPGHMNVLLAEANVPYPQLREMEDINPEFDRCDIALVIGANDVTNPAARRPGSPVSGMPILDVDHAKNIIVIKRSMGRGYAGIDNELYVNPKTGMLFADAKAGLAELITAVKAL